MIIDFSCVPWWIWLLIALYLVTKLIDVFIGMGAIILGIGVIIFTVSLISIALIIAGPLAALTLVVYIIYRGIKRILE